MIYFIVNTHGGSGRAKITWDKLKVLLEKKEVKYKEFQTLYKDHAKELAHKICTGKAKSNTIVVVGGDGTVNNVLNGITDFSKVKFAVIPTGSGNDFVRGLGIPSKEQDLENNLDIILEGKVRRKIDIGRLTPKGLKPVVFGISCGLGLDAIVCEKTDSSRLKNVFNKMHIGNLIYLFFTVYTLFSMKTNVVSIKFDREKSCDYTKMIFAASLNTFAEGGGVKMAPLADTADGKLDVCLAYGIPRFMSFAKLPFLSAGKHTNLNGFLVKQFKKMTLKSDSPVTCHADGEAVGKVSQVTVECLAQKLSLLQ